jgi:hypothetical protein
MAEIIQQNQSVDFSPQDLAATFCVAVNAYFIGALRAAFCSSRRSAAGT